MTDTFHCPDAQAFLRLLYCPNALLAVRSLHPQQEWHYAPHQLPDALALLTTLSGKRALYACLNPVREDIGDAYAQDGDTTASAGSPSTPTPSAPPTPPPPTKRRPPPSPSWTPCSTPCAPTPGLDAALVRSDSGNGAHALLRLPDYPPHAEGGGRSDQWKALKRLHTALCKRFSTGAVKLDTAVMNPSRIWRIPGTLNVKGDNSPDRPHRLARLLSAPDPLTPLDLLAHEPALTQAFAIAPPTPPLLGAGGVFPDRVPTAPELGAGGPPSLPPWWTDLIAPGERTQPPTSAPAGCSTPPRATVQTKTPGTGYKPGTRSSVGPHCMRMN